MNIHYKSLKSILLNHFSFFWIGIFIITSFIIITYYNTITSPFNFDDEQSIINNEGIKKLSSIPERLTSLLGRPVLFITFTLDYHIGGLNPTGYHLVNIALHTAVSILVYIIVWHTVNSKFQIFSLPFLSALIFAIHPINTESVTYVISRSSVLSTFFYLLSLLMFMKANKKRGKGQGARGNIISSFTFYLLTILFFIFALGSKEDAVTLPAIILLYHFFFVSEDKTLKDYFKRYRWIILVLALLSISYPLLRYIRLGMVGTSEAKNIFTPFTYLITGIKVAVYYYMKLLLLPINLNVDPDIRAVQFLDFYVISALSLIIALLVVILRRRNGLLSFSILWYFIALSPTSSIFPLNDPASEHRLYLPAVGFCIFMAYCLGRGKGQEPALNLFQGASLPLQVVSRGGKEQNKNHSAIIYPISLVLLLLMFSMLTIKRNFIWGDVAAVWKDSIGKSPNKPRPYYNMAISYEKMGMFDKAIWGYKGTIEHLQFIEQPHFWTESHIRLANIYLSKGLYMNAIPLYEKVLKAYPEKPEALNGMAVINMKLSRFEKAKEMLERVVKIKSDYAEAYNNLGTVYANMGMLNEAIASFKRAIKIKPAYTEAILNLKIVRDMTRP